MRSTITGLIASIAVLSEYSVGYAQSGGAANSQSSLRARLPFSGPANTGTGQRGINSTVRPTTGSNNFSGNYTGGAANGYQDGMGWSRNQAYVRGGGPMVPVQRPNVQGVGANNFNPANPNATQQTQDDDFGWMDYEPAPQMAYPASGPNLAGGALPSNTSNAANAQPATAATEPGANQVVRAAGETGARTSNMQASGAAGLNSDLQDASTTQQPYRWRFYETPLAGRIAPQQNGGTSAPAGNSAVPTQSQQPSGVGEAASGGPIKY